MTALEPVAPVPIVELTVGELLAQSRAAHAQSKHHRGRIDHDGKASTTAQPRQAGAKLQEALRLRLEAEALDPIHLDPAWLEDIAANSGQSSDAMVSFFGRYLTPIEARA